MWPTGCGICRPDGLRAGRNNFPRRTLSVRRGALKHQRLLAVMRYPFSIQSTLPRFRTTSPGEDLWFALRDLCLGGQLQAFPPSEWFELTAWVEPSGALAHYHADATVATAVFKLLKAARRVEREDELIGNALHSSEGEELFLRGISRYMVEQMGFAALDAAAHRLIPPLVLRSHSATRADINERARMLALEEAEDSSFDGDIRCYCCHSVLWSAGLGLPKRDIALDHVWPRSLGGSSNTANLLPICETCNGAKGDRASWSVFGVVLDHTMASNGAQADLLLGLALHRRAATKLAMESYLTLGEAYSALGPRTSLATIDPLAGRHFFNLSAHDPSKLVSLW